jgi:hypothetical protein
MPPELTPDEALNTATEFLTVSGLDAFAEQVMPGGSDQLPSFIAAILLVMQDVQRSGCTCDACARLRETLESYS